MWKTPLLGYYSFNCVHKNMNLRKYPLSIYNIFGVIRKISEKSVDSQRIAEVHTIFTTSRYF